MPVEMAQQSGIQAWINQYGNIIYFFGQLFFWLALAVAAVYAVVLFKRLVDYKVGASPASDSAATSDVETADSSSEPIDIEKFVE